MSNLALGIRSGGAIRLYRSHNTCKTEPTKCGNGKKVAKQNLLQPVDEQVRRAAKGLLRTSRYGALATIDPITGAPLASRIALASDSAGHPVTLISQLSGHFGALENEPRASILIGEPGKGDPLAHPRMTVFGRAERVADDDLEALRARYLARHPKAQLYVGFGDFAFWRLKIEGASFNQGFGSLHEMKSGDLIIARDIELEGLEADAVQHMNQEHGEAIADYARGLGGQKQGVWQLACIDAEGMDLTSGDEVVRIWFDPPLASAAELRPRLVALAKQARQN